MVKKTIIVYEFDEMDKKLLNTPLPPNPCHTCNAGVACCGCAEGRQYAELIEPYRKAGIYEIARNIETIRAINEEMRELEIELNKANQAIPAEVRTFLNPEIFE